MSTARFARQNSADPPAASDWGLDQQPVRQLLGAVRVADRALARGLVVCFDREVETRGAK